jgi:katanin p60 ATPase-containing subunit A1
MASSLLAIRATTDANSAEQKRNTERKKNLLILVSNYLIENGYVDAAERLQHETNGLTTKYAVADNIDLTNILIDYENYYEIRFDKKPKLTRKLGDNEEVKAFPTRGGKSDKKAKSKTTEDSSSKAAPETEPTNKSNDFSVTGTNINKSAAGPAPSNTSNNSNDKDLEDRMLKPSPAFFGDSEMKQLANVISREIYVESPNVRFQDIVHLDEAKRLLMEAVQLPLRFPTLFTGILRPWRGILLHGPPGTGKTLLAKAVATECNTTFFNISASTLISKWRGDSEKLVRVLFDLARYHAPSTIFLDEIDSILTSRDSNDHGGSEHEASRRMKTELLIQMDGLGNHSSNPGQKSSQVFVMAASNLPWELDIALLRRLEKRVLVSLPSLEAREMMFRKHLGDRCVTYNADNELQHAIDFHEIATLTEGYSGADIELVCREAAMMPVRRLIQKIDNIQPSGDGVGTNMYVGSNSELSRIPDPPALANNAPIAASNGNGSRYAAAKKATIAMKNWNTTQSEIDTLLKNDPVTLEDIKSALQSTKPSSDGKITK